MQGYVSECREVIISSRKIEKKAVGNIKISCLDFQGKFTCIWPENSPLLLHSLVDLESESFFLEPVCYQ